MDAFALIDSGASLSIFHLDVAKFLDINISSGNPIDLSGVGGGINGYIHYLKLGVAQTEFLCPVVFSPNYKAPFNLLGRKGFFENFQITFAEKQRLVKLE